MDMQKNIIETVAYLQKNGIKNPKVGIVLGTGLGELVNTIEVLQSFDYTSIPHFVTSTVEFHKGKLIYGIIGETEVIIMQGRFHYYEGYSMQEITYPIRLFKELGIQYLLLSNAAGGMHSGYKKGDLVTINDHINLLPENPLRGTAVAALGNRFVDMCTPYSAYLNGLISNAAKQLNVKMHIGIYVAVQGPNLETKAEYRYLKAAGADLVGMSTVPEVIVANHIGLPCAAISVVTDECDADNLKPINIEEIIATAHQADKILSSIFVEVIKTIN
jgi:purine-nucleoside phosphorylase